MDSYIILTPEIGNMGGGQMYTNNKVKFLKEHGWNVHVFYFKEGGDIKMPLLKEYNGNVIREFRYAFYYVPIFRRKMIANKIRKKVKGSNRIILESQLIDLAFWGEDIAKRIGANHIINFIEEQVPLLSDKKLDFFEFKLRQWQMLNASDNSQKRVFKDKWKSDYAQYYNHISYKCTNVVFDIPCDIIFSKCDYTIISIGRLDKPYVEPMSAELLAFVRKFPDKVCNIIYVGGSPDGSKEIQIPRIFEGVSNAKIYMLGYTFPIPQTLIESASVAIASANSVLVTSDFDIPTVSLDMNDYQAIGVYGYDTTNKFKRGENESPLHLSELLVDILISKKYPKKGVFVDSMKDVNIQFNHEMNFLTKSGFQYSYYNLSTLNTTVVKIYSQLKWFIYQFVK